MITAKNTTIRTSSTAATANAATGYFSARNPRPTTKRSSPKLRIQFENGSGLVLAAARVLVLLRWLPAATTPPASATSPSIAGDVSPSVVTATSAPPTGRIAVCTMSHSVATYGILSAQNSTKYMTAAAPMTRSLLKAWNCGGSSTQP